MIHSVVARTPRGPRRAFNGSRGECCQRREQAKALIVPQVDEMVRYYSAKLKERTI